MPKYKAGDTVFFICKITRIVKSAILTSSFTVAKAYGYAHMIEGYVYSENELFSTKKEAVCSMSSKKR